MDILGYLGLVYCISLFCGLVGLVKSIMGWLINPVEFGLILEAV
jgi:hypothetical protein